MRPIILISLLLLALSCQHSDPPCEPAEKIVEVLVPVDEMSWEEARWQALELEVQEALGRVLAHKTKLPEGEALEIVKVAYRESNAQQLDVFRTLGFIIAESYGKKEALSKSGARGLMQIMPLTGKFIADSLSEKWLGVNSLYNIERNIRYGIWYYKALLEQFEGDEHAAIAAYNWGPEEITKRNLEGKRLPRRYPRLVRTAEAGVRKEFYDENRDLIWRSYSRAERIFSGR